MAYTSKKDQTVAAHRHYLKNKKEIKKRARKFLQLARIRNRKHTNAYLKEHPCIDCSEKDIIVLEFDHVRETKLDSICRMVNNGFSIKRIDKEIAKCKIRCANCHRRKTKLTYTPV